MVMNRIVYHTTLATYFATKPHFFDGESQKKPHIRKCSELPWQQTKAQLWDEVTETLCDLDFIQAKACAKLIYDLVKDYHYALDGLPEYQPEKEKERKRQERLEMYIRELIDCSVGNLEIKKLFIPKCSPLMTREQVSLRIKQIKNQPTKADKLIDFIIFLGKESGNLQMYASEHIHFSIQQAWNYSNGGPVGDAANKIASNIIKKILTKTPETRPHFSPLNQVIRVLNGHSEPVKSVCITPDGKKALSGSNDKTCILWDLMTGEILFILKGHTKGITSVSITPDGKKAVSTSLDNTCIVWDLITGILKKTLIGHTDEVTSMAISPDGNWAISGSKDNNCIFWDLNSGNAIWILKGHSAKVNTVCITADISRAISGSNDKTCIVWDLTKGVILKKLKGEENDKAYFGGISNVSITPKGKKAIACSTHLCAIWDLEKGNYTTNFKYHCPEVVSITPDGKRAISFDSTHNYGAVWDTVTGEKHNLLDGHSAKINSVSITSDGKRAISGSDDNSCILWEFNENEVAVNLKKHGNAVKSICVIPNNRIIISSCIDIYRTSIKWDSQTGEFIDWNYFGDSYIRITADGKWGLSRSKDLSSIVIWNLSRKIGAKIKELKGHASFILNLYTSPDGKIVISSSLDRTCIIWDLNSGEQIRTIKGYYGIINFMAFTPDGKRVILTTSNNDCYMYNMNTGELKSVFLANSNKLRCINISADGRKIIAESLNNSCKIWDIRSGKVIQELKGHFGNVNYLTITTDNKMAISSSDDHTCIVWDLETGTKICQYVSNSKITACAFFASSIFVGEFSGNTALLKSEILLSNSEEYTITINKIWDHVKKQYLTLLADCTVCGHRFEPSISVISLINKITEEANLKPEQSPCLELPDVSWENPGLLSECPKCGAKIKFNPFIVGGED